MELVVLSSGLKIRGKRGVPGEMRFLLASRRLGSENYSTHLGGLLK